LTATVLLHPRRKMGVRQLAAKFRIAEVADQHDALGFARIPRLVLDGITEDQRFPFLPLPSLAAYAQCAPIVDDHPEVATQHELSPTAISLVRRDMRARCKTGKPRHDYPRTLLDQLR